MTDLLVAMAFLCLALIPLATSFTQERRILLSSYQRAIAMEIVDGEMELIAAGDWRSYSNGVHQLTPRGNAATNLPPGKLQLTVAGKHFSLEWQPAVASGGRVHRELTLP
jgi:hypothetical protein